MTVFAFPVFLGDAWPWVFHFEFYGAVLAVSSYPADDHPCCGL